MTDRDTLLAHLEELLDASAFEDYGPNGLQVPGCREIQSIVSGVSAGLELFERAAGHGAQLVLCHHGLFWGGSGAGQALTEGMASRLRVLLENEMNLAAYHLPLDAHPTLGNNALLADALGLRERAPFAAFKGRAIGVRGELDDGGIPATELVERVRAACGREPLHFAGGPPTVRTLGIVSGGAARQVSEAVALGLDAYLTGEPTESVMTEALEGGVHFLAAGHYATETFGVRALGEHLAQRFGLEHAFVDLPNPV
jgi:dinuclear metal center YbgI/SA1388 family protein